MTIRSLYVWARKMPQKALECTSQNPPGGTPQRVVTIWFHHGLLLVALDSNGEFTLTVVISVLPLGDPTRFGTLPPHPIVRDSVRRALDSGQYEGYGNSAGLQETRRAVAEAFTCKEAPLTADVSLIN